MRNPPHPGPEIALDLAAIGMSVGAAADLMCVDVEDLFEVIEGRSPITPEMAHNMEAVIGSTAEQWLRLQQAYDQGVTGEGDR